MSRIKIEDLAVIDAMDAAEAAGTVGGQSWNRYGYRYSYQPRYSYPSYQYQYQYNRPGNYFNSPNRLIAQVANDARRFR